MALRIFEMETAGLATRSNQAMQVPPACRNTTACFIFVNMVLAVRFSGKKHSREGAPLLRRNICSASFFEQKKPASAIKKICGLSKIGEQERSEIVAGKRRSA
jgi:hypothetical protein